MYRSQIPYQVLNSFFKMMGLIFETFEEKDVSFVELNMRNSKYRIDNLSKVYIFAIIVSIQILILSF